MSEVYIDDVDASVAYAGNWQSATDSQRSYHTTIHFTNSTNSKATLTFTGISVTVHGVVRSLETPQSSYSLDGGDSTVFQSTPRDLTQYGALFYTSPILRNGQHNLVITNLDANAGTFFIDYFVIVRAPPTSPTSSPTHTSISSSSSKSSTRQVTQDTSSSVSSSRTSSPRSSTSTTLVTPKSSGSSSSFGDAPLASTSPSISGNSDATPKNSHNMAAIVGAVAAVAIVAFFIIIYLCLRRRRKQQKESKSWIISSFSGGVAALAASLTPAITPQTNEERPPPYAMSEPPAYESDIAPAVQVSDSRLSGRVGLRRLEKSSKTTTQSSDVASSTRQE